MSKKPSLEEMNREPAILTPEEAAATQGGFNPQPDPPRYRLASYSLPGSDVVIQDEENRVL
jgi:hypothetical protein